MNVETPPTISCPACDSTAHAAVDDQWGKTEGWRCRDCRGYVALDDGRRTFDVTTIAPGTEFDLASLSEQVNRVTGIESPHVVRAGEKNGRYRVIPERPHE